MPSALPLLSNPLHSSPRAVCLSWLLGRNPGGFGSRCVTELCRATTDPALSVLKVPQPREPHFCHRLKADQNSIKHSPVTFHLQLCKKPDGKCKPPLGLCGNNGALWNSAERGWNTAQLCPCCLSNSSARPPNFSSAWINTSKPQTHWWIYSILQFSAVTQSDHSPEMYSVNKHTKLPWFNSWEQTHTNLIKCLAYTAQSSIYVFSTQYLPYWGSIINHSSSGNFQMWMSSCRCHVYETKDENKTNNAWINLKMRSF